MLSTFTQRVHTYIDVSMDGIRYMSWEGKQTSFCADTPHFSTGALSHLLCEGAEVDASL